MKFIKIFFINTLLLIVLSTAVTGQDMSQIMFINELDGKITATYGDVLRMFGFQAGTVPDSYLLKGYNDDSKLTKGMASLMTARHLGLNKSLMYKIFGTERYAYRACMAERFFNTDGSENDVMSGPELIELFGKIDEFKGRR